MVISVDEGPGKANFEKVPTLKPAFDKNGTITAANASTINDGAAAVVLGGEEFKSQAKFKILSYASHAQNPTWFATAPVEADDVDDDASQAAALAQLEKQAAAKARVQALVNIYGGGVSLGHPIGCSGTRIVVTLMTAMENKKSKYGMASICIGGGEALAMIIERL